MAMSNMKYWNVVGFFVFEKKVNKPSEKCTFFQKTKHAIYYP